MILMVQLFIVSSLICSYIWLERIIIITIEWKWDGYCDNHDVGQSQKPTTKDDSELLIYENVDFGKYKTMMTCGRSMFDIQHVLYYIHKWKKEDYWRLDIVVGTLGRYIQYNLVGWTKWMSTSVHNIWLDKLLDERVEWLFK